MPDDRTLVKICIISDLLIVLQIYLRDGSAKEPVLDVDETSLIQVDLRIYNYIGAVALITRTEDLAASLEKLPNKAEVSEVVEDSLDKKQNADH